MKKILTVEDLEQYFKKFQVQRFSAEDAGYQICVHIPVEFAKKEFENSEHMLYAWTKLFHVGTNRNKSYISHEAAVDAMGKLAYKPILANFIDAESGERDFSSHDMLFDEEGNPVYVEKPVGCFTADAPYIEMDESEGHEFVCAKIAIPRNYTETAEILERKGGTKISMEAIVDEMTFNPNEKALEFVKFEITGATLLGDHISEGMKGAKVSLEDFRLENNSVVQQSEKLNQFNAEAFLEEAISGDKKGGTGEVDKKHNEEQLMEEEAESVTEDAEVSEGSVEEKQFNDPEDPTDEPETEPEAPAEGEEPSEEEEPEVQESEDGTGEGVRKKMSVNESGNQVVTWEISMSETAKAVMEGIAKESGQVDLGLFEMFDNRVIVSDWRSDRMFEQRYLKTGDDVVLEGSLTPVFVKYMTKSEIGELDTIRESLESAQTELASFKKKESDAKKDEILMDSSYAPYLEEEEFTSLIANRDNYSAEEFADKAELAFAKCVKRVGLLKRKKKSTSSAFSFTAADGGEEVKSKYGKLFAK